MAAVDNSAASAYLKERFSKRRIENLSYGNSPAFGQIPKAEDFGGEDLKVPISYADLKGRSANFAVAQANKQGSDTSAWQITTVEDYALFSIKGKTIKQSRGDMNAWLPALEKEAESAARALARSTSIGLFRDANGVVGVAASNSSTNITLGSRADIQNFEVGMTIEVSATATPGTKRSSAKGKIVTVYRDAGVITLNATATTCLTGLTTNDNIHPEGDCGNRATGFAGWILSTDALAAADTNHFGVNVATDVTRLGGCRFDANGMNIQEAIIDAAARVAENGGTPDTLFINFDKWRELMNYLGSQKVYTQGTAYAGGGPNADISYKGVVIHGPNSEIKVFADRHCQANTGWLLQLDTWKLHSSGGVPQLLEEDGQSILREATDDAYEGRWGAYYQIYCYAPGYNCRIINL